MAITIDQATLGTNAASGGATTVVLTTTNAVASGGFIVLGIGAWFADATVTSVGGGGLTWTVDASPNPTSSPTPSIASAPAPSGLASSTAITATFVSASASSRHICGTSFLGVDLASPLDVAGTTQGQDPGTAWTTGNLSIAAGSLIIGVAFNQDNRTSVATAPSTELFDFGGAGTEEITMAYRIEASAGSYSVAGTLSGSTTHNDIGVAYKVEPAPPSPVEIAWITA